MLNIKIYRLTLIIGIVGIISACQTPGSTGPESSIKQFTDDEAKSLVGKKLRLDKNLIIMNEDGTISGEWGGGPVAGAWELKDGYWCRSYSEFYEADFTNVEQCHSWEIKGSEIYAVRNKGKGKPYRLKITE